MKSATLNLQQRYGEDLRGQLRNELKLTNVNQVPRLTKVVVSVGLGRAKEDKKMFDAAASTLAKITGQRAVTQNARKSIASFKLREGQPIGLKVTLRGQRMYEFTERLIHVVLPRVRDFHGVPSKSFDKQGNYSLGFVDQSIWPELSFEDTATPHGIEVTFVIAAESTEHAKTLLSSFGLPFSKEKES